MRFTLEFLVCLAGCTLLALRLHVARRGAPSAGIVDASEVSVIVPARNEAHNLPRLLASLLLLRPAPREIIVVDDHSTDGTGDLARAFGVRVVVPEPLPGGLVGKPWACLAGVRAATGSVYLFTDADTEHAPTSLGYAMAALRTGDTGLVSALPTHVVLSWWERLQGPFQLLLLLATRAGARVRGTRRFAIGQYLLIPRGVYEAVGGHAAVEKRLAEDLALAQAVAQRGHAVRVLFAPGLFRVRMYPEGLHAFVAGWRRNFRDGFRAAGLLAACELTLVITYLLGVPLWGARAVLGGEYGAAAVFAVGYTIAAAIVGREQRHYGAFSGTSALLYPLGVGAFVWVSLLSAFDTLWKRKVVWRGRSIEHSA